MINLPRPSPGEVLSFWHYNNKLYSDKNYVNITTSGVAFNSKFDFFIDSVSNELFK